MSGYARTRGTTLDEWGLGGPGGPRLQRVQDAGVGGDEQGLEARQPGGAFGIVRGQDAVGPNDLTTKRQLDTVQGRNTSVIFTGANQPYVTSTNNDVYDVLGMVGFPGSLVQGAPVAIKILARRKTTGDWAARLFDMDNQLTIAEVVGQSNGDFAIVDMGTIGNIPTGQAILELQGKKVDVASLALSWT